MNDLLQLPINASSHGSEIDNMIGLLHWLMAVLFVIWGAYFIYTLIRFRGSRNKKADYVGVKTHASSYLEVAVALFEGFLLIGFAVPVWSSVVTELPSEEDAVVVRVVAEQFAWNVHYPGADGVFGRRDISLVTSENPLGLDREDPVAKDDITTINQLSLPVNKDILVYLSSKDVIHSFGIPLLRVKQDAIPGQQIPVWFRATMTNEEIREQSARSFLLTGSEVPRDLVNRIAYADYVAADGAPVLSKGDLLTEETIMGAVDAGITEIRATLDTPMEIACAQLCGLGHYRMRGTVTIMSGEEYQAWLDNEASYLEY
jgi:cytochrome c oxidase subunit 2